MEKVALGRVFVRFLTANSTVSKRNTEKRKGTIGRTMRGGYKYNSGFFLQKGSAGGPVFFEAGQSKCYRFVLLTNHNGVL